VKLQERLDEDDLQIFVFVARQIWFRRNKFIFDGKFQSPSMVNQIATTQLQGYRKVEEEHRRGRSAVPVPTVPWWKKPPAGSTKLNWDAAIDKQGARMGVGVVARNHNGDVVGAMCMTKPHIVDPTTAEAVGAWQTVEFCRQMGFSEIIIEGDSIEVVQALRRGDSCWTSYGTVINDAKRGLLNVPQWEVSHVKRGANVVAHMLAKQALVLGADTVWRGTSPACIQDYVYHEKLIPNE
jgi:ribonuclease HI